MQEAAATSPMAAGAAEVGAGAAELHAMCGLLVTAVCDDWKLSNDLFNLCTLLFLCLAGCADTRAAHLTAGGGRGGKGKGGGDGACFKVRQLDSRCVPFPAAPCCNLRPNNTPFAAPHN